MNKSRLIDQIILIVLLIGVSTFPVTYFVHDFFWYYTIEALMMLAVLLFILYFDKKHVDIYGYHKKINWINVLWLLPAITVAFSNLIYALFLKEEPVNGFGWFSIPHAAFIILNCAVEEYIFRKHLLGNLTHPKTIIRILISAAIFAACHLTIFFSTFNPLSLVVVAYTFGLGMVLGLIYCYTNSLGACIIFHVMFNMLNDFLFESLFFVNNPLWYYLINAIITVIVGIYLFIVYWFKLRKNPAELGFYA